MELYTMKTLIAVTGLGRSKLDTWLFKELIHPAEPAPGSGYSSKYSVENIAQLHIINMLARSGLRLVSASSIAKRCMLNVDKKFFVDMQNHDRELNFLKSGGVPPNIDFCLMVDTPGIIQNVVEAIRDGVSLLKDE